MIGIVLIGHSHIASEMLKSLEFVVGEQVLMDALDVNHDSTPEALMDKLTAKIHSCDTGQGVLLLADMFGGTPCNVAMGCLQPGHVEVVSGFNLPLLIKAATLRMELNSLSELARLVVQAGRQYIQVAPPISTAFQCHDHDAIAKHADA